MRCISHALCVLPPSVHAGQPQGLSLRLSRGRCIAKTAFHNVGAAFHRRPQDFAKADTGIRKKRHAPTACSNSVCPAAQKTGGHRDPPLQDFIQADVGRTRLFLLPSKSRDSPRVGTRRGTPGEGSPALLWRKGISLRARSDQRFHLWIPPPLKRRAKR